MAKKKLKQINPSSKEKKQRMSLLDSFSSSESESSESDESSEEEKIENESIEGSIQISMIQQESLVNIEAEKQSVEELESKIKQAEKIKEPPNLYERRKKNKKKA